MDKITGYFPGLLTARLSSSSLNVVDCSAHFLISRKEYTWSNKSNCFNNVRPLASLFVLCNKMESSTVNSKVFVEGEGRLTPDQKEDQINIKKKEGSTKRFLQRAVALM